MSLATKWKSKEAITAWKGYVNDKSRKWRYEADYFIVSRQICRDKKAYRVNQPRKKWELSLNAIDQYVIARKNRQNWDWEWKI